MNGFLGRDSAWIIWANDMNLKHASCAGLIARPVDLQSMVLLLCYGYPQTNKTIRT